MAPEHSHPSYASTFGRTGTGPLSGVLIADLGRVLAGPYCTMLLADLGATVLKIESPTGDETRSWRPPVYEDESTYYLSINRNKHSISLDFSDPADLEIAQRIASRADVLVENFKPGGLHRFGLDYESVTATNPEIIYASITGFGTAGGAELPGYDLLVQALSGLMSITGAPDTEPFRSGIAVFDIITGLHTCIGILAALHHRDESGHGQLVELDLMSSALSGMTNQTGGYAISGNIPTRIGNEHPSIYPYAPFPTADGELILAIGNDGQFRTLCDVIGAPHLSTDPRFARNVDRSLNRDTLRPVLQSYLAGRPASAWFDLLAAAKLPCAPIQDVRAGIEFAERIGLEPVVSVGHGSERLPGIRNPIRLSRTPASYDLVPPRLNSSGQQIRDWLAGDDRAPVTAATVDQEERAS